MASKQSEQLVALYKDWTARLAANPDMPLDEMRAMFEHLGDVTAEPGSVDYIETDAGGVPALWAVPKGCADDRVLLCSHGGGYVVCSMVLASQNVRTSGEGGRLPGADRELPAGTGEHPPGARG